MDAAARRARHMTFAPQHRTKLHSTDPLERLNKEVKRRPTSSASSRTKNRSFGWSAPMLMERNDDWQTQNRYMQIEGFAEPADKIADLRPCRSRTQGSPDE